MRGCLRLFDIPLHLTSDQSRQLDSWTYFSDVSHLRYEEKFMATSMLHVRIEEDLKAKATQALAAMGLSTSDAVRLLFHRIVADQAFPLELKVPNAETRAAMQEAEEVMRSGKLRFSNADELFADLEKAGRE
jgi:DNA-damage-inducible protein J